MFCWRLWSVGLKSNNRIAQKAVNLLVAVNMTTITDMVARGWENFVARPRGPLNLRFIIQPTLASIIALRAGLKDANAGRPAYLWAVFTNSDYRKIFLHGGLKTSSRDRPRRCRISLVGLDRSIGTAGRIPGNDHNN